jgi:putative nucleotidyltransferase with HDIG domain
MKENYDKIDVTDLCIGMYVSKLDCPWLETPFPFQGFYIRTLLEIKELKGFCKFVYIDAKKANMPYKQCELFKPSPLLLKKRNSIKARFATKQYSYTQVNIGKYGKTKKPFKKEIKTAKSLLNDLSWSVEQLGFKLRVGERFDFKQTNKITKAVVNSVLRNPNALICLSRLKEQGDYTYNHSLRCCILATILGRYLGLNRADLLVLATGVLLADIGKTKIKRALLNSRQGLSASEKIILEGHVELGVEILAKNNMEHNLLVIAETHHERYDGSGYPYSLVGNEIPLFGQIAGLVDVFDAMTNKKTYGKHYTSTQVIDWLYGQRDGLFSAQLIEDFIQAIGLYPAGTKVLLSDNSKAVVISQNPEKRLKPVVLILETKDKKILTKPKRLDLSKNYSFSKKQKPMVVGALIN